MKSKLLRIILILLVASTGLGVPQEYARAQTAPDLRLISITPEPRNPVIWQAININVMVENVGSTSPESWVRLVWCCGQVSLPVRALVNGESERLTFTGALLFNQPGKFTITAQMDPDQKIAEQDENNNSLSTDITITLRKEKIVTAPDNLSDEGDAIAGPDTDLLKIGRVEPWPGEPYLADDVCPTQAGTLENHGCPVLDIDGDGLIVLPTWPSWKNEDHCPAQPGPEQNNGCPTLSAPDDRDGDKISDSQDACPDLWVDSSNRGNGCPNPDSDGDQIVDTDDPCPQQPGLDVDRLRQLADTESQPGCPVTGPAGDQDNDGLRDDRLNRTAEDCLLEDNPNTDFGCHVFLPGQRQNACGATALAYILRYFGRNCCRDVNLGDVCEPDCVDYEIRASTITFNGKSMFTDPIALREYARLQGLNAEIYINGDVEQLRYFVDQGIPVMLDIVNTAGSTSVWDGHWINAISLYEAPQSFSGTTQTQVSIYDPVGRQYSIAPDRLYKFWDKLELPVGKLNIYLWTRLYIAVSPDPLPPGDTEAVRSQLAAARGLSLTVEGLDIFADIFDKGQIYRLLEGVNDVVGGIEVFIAGFMNKVVGDLGEEVPLIGGFISSLADFGADLAASGANLVNDLGDLLNPANWGDPEKIGRLLLHIGENLLAGLEAAGKAIVHFFVDGIGGLLSDIWNGLKSIGCKLFGVGCPGHMLYFKHAVSSDACMETTMFMNGFQRTEAVGYISSQPASDLKPLWLYVNPYDSREISVDLDENDGDVKKVSVDVLSESHRQYKLCDRADLATVDTSLQNLGIIGYSSKVLTGDSILSSDLISSHAYNGYGCNLGFFWKTPTSHSNSVLVWAMTSMDSSTTLLSTDACAFTQSFISQDLEGYTREKILAYLLVSEDQNTIKLYRFFDPGNQDVVLSTNPKLPEIYVNQGYLGYIYTLPRPDTIPLYQFANHKRHDHLVTLDLNAEGLPDYTDRTVLGYVLTLEAYQSKEPACLAPIWRFCKRIQR